MAQPINHPKNINPEIITIGNDKEDIIIPNVQDQYSPMNDLEQSAAIDNPNALRIPKAAWEAILRRTNPYSAMTPERLHTILGLPMSDVQSIFKGLQARGYVSKTADSEGNFSVSHPPEEQAKRERFKDRSRRKLGHVAVVIFTQKSEYTSYLRYIGRRFSVIPPPATNQEPISPIQTHDTFRQWGVVIEDNHLDNPDYHTPRVSARAQNNENRNQRPVRKGGDIPDPHQRNHALRKLGERVTSSPQRPETKKSTEKNKRITDNWELGLLYIAGELNKQKKQPPAMSPASLAHKYVNYFKLYEAGVKDGMQEAAARAKAEREILPLAAEHFAQMQALGLVAEGYVKIDPNDPSHDSSTTGHKVLATPEQIQNILSDYRNQGNKKP